MPHGLILRFKVLLKKSLFSVNWIQEKKNHNNFGLVEIFLRTRIQRKYFHIWMKLCWKEFCKHLHHALEFERKSNDILLGSIERERFMSKYKVWEISIWVKVMFVGKNSKHRLIISLEIQEKCDDFFFPPPFSGS